MNYFPMVGLSRDYEKTLSPFVKQFPHLVEWSISCAVMLVPPAHFRTVIYALNDHTHAIIGET
jgi:hypothetical protein